MTKPLTAAIVLSLATALSSSRARDLSLADRIRAQEVIERVYYLHQQGATRSVTQEVSREALEGKVDTYLKQSVALSTLWNTPVTSRMLEKELARIARDSKDANRLAELYAALHDDPFLIAECIARPAVVDRMARSFLSSDDRVQGEARMQAETLRRHLAALDVTALSRDPRGHVVDIVVSHGPGSAPGSTAPGAEVQLSPQGFHRWRLRAPVAVGELSRVLEDRDSFSIEMILEEAPDRVRLASFSTPKITWDEWWSVAAEELDPTKVVAVGIGSESLPVPNSEAARFTSSSNADIWENGELDDLPDPRSHHTAVWTGTHMIVWGGSGSNTGGRYDPVTDAWSPTSTTGAPDGRADHTAVWTGDRMIVWGGYGEAGELSTGGSYDPVADRWQAISTVGAPQARTEHTAVWTGSRMVVWGGNMSAVDLDTGGLYDPVSDSWTQTSSRKAPDARSRHTAVWTGKWMIVWGGGDRKTGGRYDPVRDKWAATSTAAPRGREHHTAAWTGSEMIIFGGYGHQPLGDGARYNPTTNRWTPITNAGAPGKRDQHVAVWSGSRMIVWGGDAPLIGAPVNTGGQYDPATDTWTSTSVSSAPPPSRAGTAVWTGETMIVWGGGDGSYALATGGRYDPLMDSWTPTTSGGSPTARIAHTVVWTGNEMIVWGGSTSRTAVKSGARYDPVLDRWTATTLDAAPTERSSHTAVWTGSEMIVWGGTDASGSALTTGGRYDPLIDRWAATSTQNAPALRVDHTAVWTGTKMIIWGGAYTGYLNTGGAYEPSTDTWTATSTLSAPSGRRYHSAVSAGGVMVVWGGAGLSGYLDTGGRYYPSTNTWLPISTEQAPSPRQGHACVWTSSRMIVWGGASWDGQGQHVYDSGALYDPLSDVWTPTSQQGAPSPRGTTGIWTGTEMVVWGGVGPDSMFLDSGGRYDPVADTWRSTAMEGAPSPRSAPMIWSGTTATVWGGGGESGFLGSGGCYLP